MRVLYLFMMIWAVCSFDLALAKHKTKHHQTAKHVTRHAAPIRRVSPEHAYRAAPVVYGSSQLASTLNTIVSPYTNGADVAVYVKSMQYRDSLYARNVNTPLTPASTLKIFTAEAALLYLGPNYRFATRMSTDAKSVKNGVLQGNLYITLSGDPTLTYDDLVELTEALKAKQIRTIAGNVYIDNTAYDQSFYGPGWIGKDKDYCYGAPISAGIVNHNCISFKVVPGDSPGKLAKVITSSKYFYPGIRNSVVTKASRGCSIHVAKYPGSTIGLEGCMSKGRYEWGVSYVVTDVPEYNRALFKGLLAQMSVNVLGYVTFGSAGKDLSVINTHYSEPMSTLVKEMLKKSDNIIAGALFKKIGQTYSGSPGSWANGSSSVSQILSKRAGVGTSGMRLLDGSGLSPDNLATPAQMMQVLDFTFHNDATSEPFITALPIAGVDGTLKHRMYNIARKVRAKTGTISGVVSLAGYVWTNDKEPLAFVIMINGNKGMGWRYKEMEDKIATALVRYKRA